MRLVFLYGPPAVGKLTVGQELAGLTGFKLFHNHVTVDPVLAVFPFGSPPYSRLVRLYRQEMMKEVAGAGVDVISTYVYAAPDDDTSVAAFIEPVLSAGGTVHFVRLTCPTDELLERVGHESRQSHRKLTDRDRVQHLLNVFDLNAAVPFGESLTIDTSRVTPSEAAAQIVFHYGLPSAERAIE